VAAKKVDFPKDPVSVEEFTGKVTLIEASDSEDRGSVEPKQRVTKFETMLLKIQIHILGLLGAFDSVISVSFDTLDFIDISASYGLGCGWGYSLGNSAVSDWLINSSTVSGTLTNTTVANNSAALVLGSDAGAYIGGVSISGSSFSGQLTDVMTITNARGLVIGCTHSGQHRSNPIILIGTTIGGAGSGKTTISTALFPDVCDGWPRVLMTSGGEPMLYWGLSSSGNVAWAMLAIGSRLSGDFTELSYLTSYVKSTVADKVPIDFRMVDGVRKVHIGMTKRRPLDLVTIRGAMPWYRISFDRMESDKETAIYVGGTGIGVSCKLDIRDSTYFNNRLRVFRNGDLNRDGKANLGEQQQSGQRVDSLSLVSMRRVETIKLLRQDKGPSVAPIPMTNKASWEQIAA